MNRAGRVTIFVRREERVGCSRARLCVCVEVFEYLCLCLFRANVHVCGVLRVANLCVLCVQVTFGTELNSWRCQAQWVSVNVPSMFTACLVCLHAEATILMCKQTAAHVSMILDVASMIVYDG